MWERSSQLLTVAKNRADDRVIELRSKQNIPVCPALQKMLAFPKYDRFRIFSKMSN
jgi:hypothetical protein